MSIQSSLATTYSLVIHDAQNGLLGAAVQSHYFSVGSTVPWLMPGVGAIMTQAMVNVSYGPRGLELLAAGQEPAAVVDALTTPDRERARRQLIVMDASGSAAIHTGADCIVHAEHVVEERDGCSVAAAANMMDALGVPAAMVRAVFDTATVGGGANGAGRDPDGASSDSDGASSDSDGGGSERASSGATTQTVAVQLMTDRLLAALTAAEAGGGDIRGRQSAALVIVPDSTAAGATLISAEHPLEIRVDDHPEPLVELERLAALAIAYRDDEAWHRTEALASHAVRPELVFWHAIDAMVSGDESSARVQLHQLGEHWIRLATRLPETGMYALDAPAWNRLIAPDPDRLFHIYPGAPEDGITAVEPGDEGFVHCSYAHQIPRVVQRHFPDLSDPYILEIDPTPLSAAITVEDSYGVGEIFPHVYDVIPESCIVRHGLLSECQPWLARELVLLR